MSMISGLIDELNKSADEWNASNMFELARMCREAADTICELQTENAKLQNDADLLRSMLSQERLEKQCYMAENAELQETLQRRTEQFEGMTEMWAERGYKNFKLRELCEDMHAALQAFCDAQDVHGDNCPLWVERTDDCELRGIERRMSELEVDA